MTSRITELIKGEGRFSYSFEVTPDISEEEINNLELEPTFFSITWHAQAHECRNLEIGPLDLAVRLRNQNKHVLLHISCSNMKKEYLDEVLSMLQDKDICNLFVILGEKFDPSTSDFKTTQELILYVRQRSGNYFCIGVAGFPDRDDKLLPLKEKIDSGADFILTQAFFEHKIYNDFLTKSRNMGINVPIIPGIFPFESERELLGFINMCKVNVNNNLLEMLNHKSGIEIVGNFIQNMINENNVKHFHFFTLNKIQRTSKLIKDIITILE